MAGWGKEKERRGGKRGNPYIHKTVSWKTKLNKKYKKTFKNL